MNSFRASTLPASRRITGIPSTCVPIPSFAVLPAHLLPNTQTVHRAALQRAIVSGCERSGLVKLELGQTLIDVDFDATRVRVRPSKDAESAGTWIEADVVLAADGVKSFTRGAMLARHREVERVVDTGQAAYRILLTREQMGDDEELLSLIDGKISHRWIGEKRHIIACASRFLAAALAKLLSQTPLQTTPSGTCRLHTRIPIFLWVLRRLGRREDPRRRCSRRTRTSAREYRSSSTSCRQTRSANGSLGTSRALGEDQQSSTDLTFLHRVHHPLKTWIEGSFALVGDSCHSTLPHLAQVRFLLPCLPSLRAHVLSQGAAQAVEDAGVLGIVLGKLKDRSEINRALRVYEVRRVRDPRAVNLG